MDDPALSDVLGARPVVQDILNTILERTDFMLVRSRTQAVYSYAVRRSVRFDNEAHTDTSQVRSIEVQHVSGSSDTQRDGFCSSMPDKSLLET